MKCNNCMHEIDADSKFCPFCGRPPFTVNPQQQPAFDSNKTVYAEDVYVGQQPQRSAPPYSAPPTPQQPLPPSNGQWDMPPQPPRKNNTALIVILIALTVIVIAGIGVLTYFLIKPGDSDDKNTGNDTTAAVSQSVSESTDGTQPMTATPVTEDPSVTVTNVKGKKLADAKKALEQLGLKVSVEEQTNDSVAKGNVINQSPAGSQKLRKGDEVILYVSKGPSKCPYDYEQKLTVDSSSGKATLYEWGDGDWEKTTTYNAVVAKDGVGQAREGKNITPKGIFKLGTVLTAQSVYTNLSVYRVNSATCVVNDVDSPYYNQIMNKSSVPAGTSYDVIGKGLTDGTTYATIYIEHNGSGFSSNNVTRGNGSAIGLRGQYNLSYSGTYGDVDISADDMADLLSRLSSSLNPVIEIN